MNALAAVPNPDAAAPKADEPEADPAAK